ncbi:Serine-protein kinase ATM [Chelonia mydas]|uniref:Serine-protein kinase ATM n=1 Tax=Chelonia mydas TaxID=8469 RepID=M7BJM5_CHEMY|nr:Serine-protein kinase ATM [Chelonia mydas]
MCIRFAETVALRHLAFLQKYIQKETDSIRLAKPNVSAATQASRHKKMQEISGLVKYFIRCANKRAPRLKCQELLNYVMDIVKDASSCAIYGADCSSILLKDILSVRKYWCEISKQQWSDLLTLYCKLYLKPSRDINRVLVARIIHTLIRGCCFQTDELNSNLYCFFEKALRCARQENASAGLDHILAAINVFFSVYAVNCRMRICKLGEEILPTVLYIWTQYRPKESLKELIIQLLQLQVRVHHPKGAKTQEKGAYDSAKWQRTLYNLYDLLVNELSLIGSRGKYSSGSRNIAVKENLIELMADICHQVFTEDTKVLEITQSYTVTQREPGDEAAPSKRRRIELGWEIIRDNLQRSQNDFDVIPWLQITARLISKYPMSLPNRELSPLLTILHMLLPQQRKGERTPYVLRCLTEVAVCQSQKLDLESTQKLELQRIWAKVWSLTVRSISFQQVETESFGLLGAIIQGNLVVIDKELWKIFSGSAYKLSSPAARCLALAMTAYVIPETLKVGMMQNNCEGNTGYMLKEAIIKWLLFCHLEEKMEECIELPPVLCSVQHTQDKGEVSFLEIEELYLQTTFDEMAIFTSLAVNIADKNLSGSGLAVNQNHRETLEHCLLVVSEQLLNSYSSEIYSKSTTAEHLVRCASLLTGVLSCYCYAGTITEEDACKSELFHKAKMVFTGKPSDAGDVDVMEDDIEESAMEVDNHVAMDRFDDHCITDFGDANESGEMQNITAISSFFPSDVCSLYRRDQEVCQAILNNLLPVAVGLGQANPNVEETGEVQGQFLTVVGAFCLFQDVKQRDSSGLPKALPLKIQQKAFENVYFRVQEGMRDLGSWDPYSRHPGSTHATHHTTLMQHLHSQLEHEIEEIEPDPQVPIGVSSSLPEAAVAPSSPSPPGDHRQYRELLQRVAYDLHIPIEEIQDIQHCLLDILQPPGPILLIAQVLERVSNIFGYKSIEDFMTSQLDYLVLEWLRMKDSGYSLSAFPYIVLNYSSLEEFYRACYKALVPHLVIRSQFEDVKSIANMIEKDWRQLLACCFPKILVNILPYFAYESHGDSEIAQQRDTAYKVYDMLKDENCLGKQIDNLSHSNLPEIVVELLMTLHEPVNTKAGEGGDLSKFTGELDPAPNPPHFPSYVIKATLDYISSCHKTKLKSIVAVLSKNPDSFQKILLAICKQAADTNNIYKKHRILTIYYLFVNLLLKEIKDGLGGAWAFVLRDIIYTLIHYINSRPNLGRDMSMRSFSLCCDLLNHVCHAAVTYCKDALENHLHVVVGTLIPLVRDQPEIQKQVLDLLKYLVIDNKDNENLYQTIKHLDPFPEHPAFKDLRATQQKIKYSKGAFSLLEFLEVPSNERESPSENLDDASVWIPQSVKTDFCQTLLPYLIHDILLHDPNETWRNLLSMHIQRFFTACCRYSSSSSRSTTPANSNSEPETFIRGGLDKISRRTMLDVVDYLRSQKRDEMGRSGYHESLYNALQSLRDREFSAFHEGLKDARDEMGRSGYHESLYNALQSLRDREFSVFHEGLKDARSVTNKQLNDIYLKWQRQSQLLKDSDFGFQEPIMALRTVILEILLEKESENSKRECIKDILTKHLVELSKLARTAKNTQVENDPSLRLIYTECLRLCGNWLAETCLENPTVIMQKYLEKAVEIAGSHSGDNSGELKSGKMKAFLSLARFSDTQYQRIENYMKSSEFENKQALLKKAKEEIGLLKEHRVQTNRYTVKVQRELELDECAIRALSEDRKRFLCKAVENYISCLLSGEEHDMWIFRLCSLWLENSGVFEVNGMMTTDAEKIPSYKFLPLMYQLAARMGTKIMGCLGFHEVLNNVDPTGKYENLVTIRSFKPEFRLAGGLNLPKIIDCIGSDGKERRQLVKGRDDLRQDAVMQQVFQMCNTLLQQNTETRKRKLTIRRYKVVPLSQRSGVLEWCSGTAPIGEFLVNPEEGAHRRYRPKDYSSIHCQKTMMDAQKQHSEEKYNIFMDVCQNFQPVFRYFCMEKFLDPAVWFEKRLAYTRSVATSSIVGYILGLGDRHVQNILIDEQTAELVHIDLGVAFEQGKILPTPETVPFRLTRDIVDGMGITGVEGVFRRCCEKTMTVMRNSQEALLTIVEVLLYDPLFDWTMNPLKALYLQQRPEDEADINSTLNTSDQECNRKARVSVDAIRRYWPPGAIPQCTVVTTLDSNLNLDALASCTGKALGTFEPHFLFGQASSSAQATMQSSSAQVTMQSQNQKGAPAWTEREVQDLIAVWGEESVLSELHSKKRNAKTFQKISEAMRDRGYIRDTTQCRVKLKELRQAYQKTKESNRRSGTEPQTCRFYAELHAILGGAATTTPLLSVDSDDGIFPAMAEDFADGEDEEEGDKLGESTEHTVLPDSQDLFITLTEIPSQPNEAGEGTSGECTSLNIIHVIKASIF